MVEHEMNTEQKILHAAREVFQKKGMTGARMQEIADKAEINKALLHYYYRTKEKLFEKVFEAAFSLFIPKVKGVMVSDKPIIEKVTFFIDGYLDLLTKHPYVPGFVISEINRNPNILIKLFKEKLQLERENVVENLNAQIQQEVEKGILRPITAQNLMINVVSLCIFPIVGKPVLKGILFNNNEKEYKAFLKQRKEFVKEFVINSIKA